MPQQLYFQYVLLSELAWSTSADVALYFSQRRPRELADFEWTIDAKDPRRITTYEKWWGDFLGPAMESKSRREPMICVDDPSFNYRFFDRSFGIKKEMWHPGQPPKIVDGYDIKKMIIDRIAFVELWDELLIQAVDILASFLRRLLAREIRNDDVAKALGRLQIRAQTRPTTANASAFDAGPDAWATKRVIQDGTDYEPGGTRYDQTNAAIIGGLNPATTPAAWRCARYAWPRRGSTAMTSQGRGHPRRCSEDGYCAFGSVGCGAMLDGVAFFFFFFTFSFGAACPAGVPCSLGCWAFTSDAVNTVAGTARLAASPTRKSTLRREIAWDWICSLIAYLSAYPTPRG